jgi:peptidoglycan-N-acetylmuramic acid deacetylase
METPAGDRPSGEAETQAAETEAPTAAETEDKTETTEAPPIAEETETTSEEIMEGETETPPTSEDVTEEETETPSESAETTSEETETEPDGTDSAVDAVDAASTLPAPDDFPETVISPYSDSYGEAANYPSANTEDAGGNLSNELMSWYFMKNNEHQPPSAQNKFDIRQFDAYYLGDIQRKVIYLTFDEGYENGYTAKILDVLKEKNVPAAFFLTKAWIKSQPELARRVAEEGHLPCNHSVTHPSMPSKSDEDIVYEIEETARYYEEITGYAMAKYFRPPMGEYSCRTLAQTQQLGYKTIFWSFAHRDWLVDDQPPVSQTYGAVMDNMHNGMIILLHAVSESNTGALPDIIDSARRAGFVFESLDTLK